MPALIVFLTVALSPTATATPTDVWAFAPTAPNLCVCPTGTIWFAGTIHGVTGEWLAVPGMYTGVGECLAAGAGVGQLCTPALPLTIPGTVPPVPTAGVSCSIAAATGAWPLGGPALYVAQDMDGNSVIDAGFGSLDVAVDYVDAFGTPQVGVGSMVDQRTIPFGPYSTGVPLHIIGVNPGSVGDMTISIDVECILF